MTGNPWIGEERHLTEISAEIRPANANPVDAHEGFPLQWGLGFGDIDDAEIQRFFELDGAQIAFKNRATSEKR